MGHQRRDAHCVPGHAGRGKDGNGGAQVRLPWQGGRKGGYGGCRTHPGAAHPACVRGCTHRHAAPRARAHPYFVPACVFVATMASTTRRTDKVSRKTLALSGPKAWTTKEVIELCEKMASTRAKVKGRRRGGRWADGLMGGGGRAGMAALAAGAGQHSTARHGAVAKRYDYNTWKPNELCVPHTVSVCLTPSACERRCAGEGCWSSALPRSYLPRVGCVCLCLHQPAWPDPSATRRLLAAGDLCAGVAAQGDPRAAEEPAVGRGSIGPPGEWHDRREEAERPVCV